ncbi:MAG: hypothetical protein LBQ63_02815 [Deltaproteobacteria bacterium]|jgi:hypothetical protein|nr:hypothetical protein [Deltaproteobacteria bacterium]
MKYRTYALALLSLTLALFLAGCCAAGGKNESAALARDYGGPTSPAPVPADHGAYSQLTMQAAEHWRSMAIEVAAKIYKAYEDREDILEFPLYVAPPNNRPFTVAFYNLLRTELVSRGVQISSALEPRSALLEYAVQSVPFDPGRFRENFQLSSGGADWSGKGRASNHEIIVNARMFYRNRFIMHYSGIRYINDADLGLYKDPQAADPLAESRRNIRITTK